LLQTISTILVPIALTGIEVRRALISSWHMIVGPPKRVSSDDLEEQIGEWLTPQQWAEYLAAGEVATLGAAVTVYAGILDPPQ